ncbi:MAG: GAF domain-containing protein [Chitinophagaceae bacterium]|nr:MAG: GAF domain-containing protein [Chitinophagaceae bacterium]
MDIPASKELPLSDDSAENARINALQGYSILDTLEEKDFDELTGLAAAICDIPVALVSLVDRERQWFKSHHGIPLRETDRSMSFCAHAINDPSNVMLVPDARQDIRFATNPLVTGNPHIVFYMGVPLVSLEGFALGTLCVIDQRPRELTDAQVKSLSVLARQVMDKLELRKQSLALEEANGILSSAMQLARLGTFVYDQKLKKLDADEQFCRMFSVKNSSLSMESVWTNVPSEERRRMKLLIRQASDDGGEFSSEFRMLAGEQPMRWCSVSGRVLLATEVQSGKVIGVVQDISDRKERQQAKDAFLGAVSHELKTPITALKSGLQLFRTYHQQLSKEALMGLIERSVRSVDRINGLVDDLLQMHFLHERQIVSGKERLNLYELIGQCIDDLPDYSQRLQLGGEQDCFVYGDRKQLEQVVHNLIDHALQRTRKKGLLINLDCEPGYVKVTIGPVYYIDNPSEAALFRRYSITDLPRLKKTGLAVGLYLCSEIILEHEGTIGVDPLEELSNQLWFRLRLAPASS